MSILFHRPIGCEETCFGNVDKGHAIPSIFVKIGDVDALLSGGVAVKVGKDHVAVGLSATACGERVGNFAEGDAAHALAQSVDETLDARICLIIVRGMIALLPKLFHFICKHAEKEDVAVADFLVNFNVCTVESADGERAVDHEFHVAGSARFFACE